MSEQLKWADVAHMYAKSNLSIMVGQFDHGAEMGMIFSKGLHENCEWADHGMWCQVKNGAFISEWGSHKPILRHLEDMTEDEARDFDFYRSGYPWKEDGKNRPDKSHGSGEEVFSCLRY